MSHKQNQQNQERRKLPVKSNNASMGSEHNNTPGKRNNEQLEPSTPSPSKKEQERRRKQEAESRAELLSDIRRIVTEVVKSELQIKVAEVAEKVDANTMEIEQIKSNHDELVTNIKITQSTQAIELKRARHENIALKEELLHQETQKRKSNLKFSNIIDKLGETAEECENQVLSMLRTCGYEIDTLSITKAYRIGVLTKYNPARQMIVGFHHPKQRNHILYSGAKLKHVCNVIVEEDFPEELQLRRKTLLPIFKEAKKTTKARLVDDTLIVNGRRYNHTNLHALPDHLQPDNIANKEKGNIICFFTFLSSYSNHHRCNVRLRNTDFNCTEQAIMYYKAKLFKDEEKAEQILNAKDPAKQKGLGKRIEGFNQNTWNQNRDRIMLEAVEAKFQQNPHLKEKLVSTGNKTLVECNPKDPYWGIGLGLQNPDIWEQSKWKGENKLGEVLGQVRDMVRI